MTKRGRILHDLRTCDLEMCGECAVEREFGEREALRAENARLRESVSYLSEERDRVRVALTLAQDALASMPARPGLRRVRYAQIAERMCEAVQKEQAARDAQQNAEAALAQYKRRHPDLTPSGRFAPYDSATLAHIESYRKKDD